MLPVPSGRALLLPPVLLLLLLLKSDFGKADVLSPALSPSAGKGARVAGSPLALRGGSGKMSLPLRSRAVCTSLVLRSALVLLVGGSSGSRAVLRRRSGRKMSCATPRYAAVQTCKDVTMKATVK
jgi:hypothetical protein